MRATFFGIELGKRSILAQRTAMDVTSHNIANANTEGYSRQRAVLSATIPHSVPSFVSPVSAQQVGTGVDVTKIEHLRNAFVDEKIIIENSALEYRAAADDLMKEIEAIMNEPGDTSIGDQLDKFWAAWEDLSINPSRSELRRNLVEESVTLVNSFQDLDMRLERLQGSPDHTFQGSIENQIEDAVKEINTLANLIGDLNVRIEEAETSNAMANDLRDKRSKAVEDLAKLINVDTTYDNKGRVKLSAGTHILVDHSKVNELHVATKDVNLGSTISPAVDYPRYSEHPEVATITLNHTQDLGNITLTVSQTAQADSQYSYLTFHPLTGPLADFGVTSGTFTLNGRTFFLDAETTTMNDLAQMIRSANINVDASINESGQLVLDSTLTGTANAISAVDGTSNLVTVLNLQVQRAARDAMFNFGGRQYVSSKNTVSDAIPGAILELKGTGVTNIDLHPIVTGGKLKGLLEVRDGNIGRLQDRLDEMAYRLVTEVNAVHRQGFGLDGVTGRNFFKPLLTDDPDRPYKDAMADIALEDFILADMNTIGAAGGTLLNPTDRLPTYNGDGDGSIAIAISQVKHTNYFNDGTANFSDFFNDIVTSVAVESQRFGSERSYREDIMTQLDNSRQSLSGVSLDEELTNLIKFQHAYNAAAKVITTVDSMLDKIINGMI